MHPKTPLDIVRLLGLLLVGGILASCAPVDARPIGGTVNVLATWDGAELEAFKAMTEPFERQTGITVHYTRTNDLSGKLWKGLAVGPLPDIAGLPGPGEMREFAKAGALIDLRDVIDVARYKAETAPAFVQLATVDDSLVGVFTKSTVKGLIWFNPRMYTLGGPSSWDDLARKAGVATRGTTLTWCLGLESGEASGWPGTDWIEDILLRQSGPQVYDDWVAGNLAWSSPQVRKAFETYGEIIAPDQLFGGAEGALATAFGDAAGPMFSDPPGCLFHHQGSFMTSFFRGTNGAREGEYDFFPFPTIDQRYAGSLIAAGDLMGMFRDTPQSRALMTYLVSSQAQSIRVERGGALSPNVEVSYPDELLRREAELLKAATIVRFDGSDLMSESVSEAFMQAVIDYTRDPSTLDDILASLDAAQTRATNIVR